MQRKLLRLRLLIATYTCLEPHSVHNSKYWDVLVSEFLGIYLPITLLSRNWSGWINHA